MIRFLLWIFVIYIVWKLVEAIIAPRKPRPHAPEPSGREAKTPSDFSNIEDADYEDLTPKPPPGTKEP